VTRLISGLAELAGRYDALLCDIWGVIHDGVAGFETACAALTRWRAEVGPVVLISNAPRPWASVAEQLADLGVPKTAWSAIVTSGDVCRDLLAERAPGPALRIGPAKDDPLYAGLGLVYAEVEEAAFIACSGPEDEDRETPEDYRPLLARAAERDLDMICANPDIVVQRGASLIYCAGALAQLYEGLGGRVVQAGKPFAPIYDLALARAGAPDRGKVLAIGDGVMTDMAGAAAQGLDALFVADGIHAAETLDRQGRIDETCLRRRLQGSDAAFAMARLGW
jgi:HAD superfamily hydrolase (TIGR01459 family)